MQVSSPISLSTTLVFLEGKNVFQQTELNSVLFNLGLSESLNTKIHCEAPEGE